MVLRDVSRELPLSISQSQFLLHSVFHKSLVCLSSQASGETQQCFYHQHTDRKPKPGEIWGPNQNLPAVRPKSQACLPASQLTMQKSFVIAEPGLPVQILQHRVNVFKACELMMTPRRSLTGL